MWNILRFRTGSGPYHFHSQAIDHAKVKGRLGDVALLNSNIPSYASVVNAIEGGENRVGDYLAVSATGKVYGTLEVEPITALPGFTSWLLCRGVSSFL